MSWCSVMASQLIDDEIEEVVLQALGHGVRRNILRIIGRNEKGACYTDLMDELKLSTGKLNYHLKQLDGLVEKNRELRYILTPLGRKSLNILTSIGQGLDLNYEKFVKVAYRGQRRSLQPLTKSFIYMVLMGDFIALVVTGSLVWTAYTGGGPALARVLSPLLLLGEISLFVWLTYVLLAVPQYVKRLERKVFELT